MARKRYKPEEIVDEAAAGGGVARRGHVEGGHVRRWGSARSRCIVSARRMVGGAAVSFVAARYGEKEHERLRRTVSGRSSTPSQSPKA